MEGSEQIDSVGVIDVRRTDGVSEDMYLQSQETGAAPSRRFVLGVPTGTAT
jgi:hypothetical protein